MRNIIIMLLTLCFLLSAAIADQARSETLAELKRMSEQGNLSAKHTLAAYYLRISEKYGGTPNETIGLSLFEEAAEAGFAESQYCLGLFYGDKDDFDNAVFWLEKAVSNGLKKAEEALKLYQEVYPRFLSNLKKGFIARDDEEFLEDFKPECRITETINIEKWEDPIETKIKNEQISSENKRKLIELYKKAKTANLRGMAILSGSLAAKFNTDKIIMWNQAAIKIYGISGRYNNVIHEFGANSAAAKNFDKWCREGGLRDGYNDNILMESWNNLEMSFFIEIK